MLKVLAPSPPVPQVSTKGKSGRAQGSGAAARNTSAMAASSSPLTPLALRAASRAPVWTGSSSSESHASIKPLAWAASKDSPRSS